MRPVRRVRQIRTVKKIISSVKKHEKQYKILGRELHKKIKAAARTVTK